MYPIIQAYKYTQKSYSLGKRELEGAKRISWELRKHSVS